MEGCFATAKEKCVGFARDKCATPFRDARIAVRERRLNPKDLGKLIHWASLSDRSRWVSVMGLDQLGVRVLASTNCRASELLGSDANCSSVVSKQKVV